MTCLVDTDVLAAWVNRDEGRHAAAAAVMAEVLGGKWGAPCVTDFVVDEALTLLGARRTPLEVCDQILWAALGQRLPGAMPLLPLVRVSDAAFRRAVLLFRRHYKRGLSFTDCTSIAVIEERRADVVVSFDHGFDGIVGRIPT